MSYITDIQSSLIRCSLCGSNNDKKRYTCTICNTKLHQRKENSLAKTTIFTLVALIFYVPANILPMMIVTSVGVVEASTIFDGIVYFFNTGSYGIASIIFIASMLVPIFKLMVLILLIYITYYKKRELAEVGMKYYRVIEFIGKWSMTDIFVVALMSSMLKFGNLSSVEAGTAAISFTIVVISTMIASHSFDTRLLWDEDNR